jgi:hypothetical protein
MLLTKSCFRLLGTFCVRIWICRAFRGGTNKFGNNTMGSAQSRLLQGILDNILAVRVEDGKFLFPFLCFSDILMG